MKVLPFIVFSISLLSSFLSQAFLAIPKSRNSLPFLTKFSQSQAVALAQDVEVPSKSSEEKKSISLPLELSKNGTTWDYWGYMFVGTPKDPKDPESPYQYPMTMSLNSVNTSVFTDACSEDEDTVWKCSTKPKFIPSKSDSFVNETNNTVTSATNNSKVLGFMGTEKMGFPSFEKADISTKILFRVNASMQMNFTGFISLSPNKNSFLEVLKNSSQITEQQFMYTTDATSEFVKISGIKFGEIPGIYKDMPWFTASKDKWQIEANYVAIDGQKGQDCNAINWGGKAFFNESTKILLPQTAYDMLLIKLKSKRQNASDEVHYKCSNEALKSYPNISIYTNEYKIDIPANAYMDFNNLNTTDNSCPLAVDVLSDTKSCITLGYYFFGYNKVVFSKDRHQIGLLKEDNLKKLTVFPFENKTGIAALILLVLVFGFVFVRSSQKEEELRIDIDNTPRQVRSESYYEYSYAE